MGQMKYEKILLELASRISDAERKYIGREPPTFEEFVKIWDGMDPLSRAVYEACAACPELSPNPDRYDRTVYEYLKQLGVVSETITLKELIGQNEEEDA